MKNECKVSHYLGDNEVFFEFIFKKEHIWTYRPPF